MYIRSIYAENFGVVGAEDTAEENAWTDRARIVVNFGNFW